MYLRPALLLSLIMLFSLPGHAQITSNQKQMIIADVFKIIHTQYVFPEVAKSMEKSILTHFRQGKYDTITQGHEFAFQLTQDLQKVSNDQHLKVNYYPQEIPALQQPEHNPEEDVWLNNLLKENNFGIKEKKVLPGNIGYLNIPMFGPLDKCADTLIAAMRTVENTDALIIDLRSCRGSLDENTIPFLCSYFFKEPVHLFDIYNRPTQATKQYWIHAWVPGKRYATQPIYILTSGRTFSGGEEIAYDLKQLKRALLIGETTRGGANPAELVVANSHYKVSVPSSRSINPITQTNWEKVGVTPDMPVKSNIALYTAHLTALKQLLATTSSQTQKTVLAQQVKTLEANKPRFKSVIFQLDGFEQAKEIAVAGSFNSWARKDLLLKKEGSKWVGQAEVAPGPISYMFIVDGKWINDPKNSQTIKEGDKENSFLVIE